MKLQLFNQQYNTKGKLTSFEIVDTETGQVMSQLFKHFKCPEDYENKGVLPIEPMLAKEYLNDKELEMMLDSEDYMAEEKLDGTRQTMHIGEFVNRLFSRNISKDTEWYVENSDSVPHLRDLEVPSLDGTIIDGEMRIDGREFKDVSSTLNCTWDEAIARQIELGFITLHVFDVIYYKGIYIAKMPLWKRKQYVKKVVAEINSPYVKEEEWTYTTVKRLVGGKDNPVTKKVQYEYLEGLKAVYPNLYKAIIDAKPHMALVDLIQGFEVTLNKRAWYEYIIANGGEGLMLKHKDGKYRHTRGREYTKWKKFITRECIIMGFNAPTMEYKGKAPDTWLYWTTTENDIYHDGKPDPKIWSEDEIAPVSKFFAMDWVGNMRFGVIVTPEEIAKWEKVNKTKAVVETIDGNLVLEVGECAGYDEPLRKEMSENPQGFIGTTVEILANEIFTKTGKLRHPRYLRFRTDKSPEQCIWKDHIEG